MGLNLTSLPDKIAEEYLDNALKVSASAFLAARGINATISVIQEIEFSVGVMSGSPGEFLDPLNDLIEKFSTVMLVSTASLGVQKIMLKISGWNLLQILTLLLLFTLMIYLLFKEKFVSIPKRRVAVIYKGLIFLLALRFTVPLMAIASGTIEEIFLAEDLNRNITELQMVDENTQKLSMARPTTDAAETSSTIESKEDKSIISLDYWKEGADSVMSSVSNAASNLNPKKGVEEKMAIIKEQLTNSLESTTNLISLFIIQSIILPLLFLFLIIHGAKGLYRYELADG